MSFSLLEVEKSLVIFESRFAGARGPGRFSRGRGSGAFLMYKVKLKGDSRNVLVFSLPRTSSQSPPSFSGLIPLREPDARSVQSPGLCRRYLSSGRIVRTARRISSLSPGPLILCLSSVSALQDRSASLLDPLLRDKYPAADGNCDGLYESSTGDTDLWNVAVFGGCWWFGTRD